MIKVGIVGGTGYTGVELLRLLAQHPQAELVAITSRTEVGTRVADMFPRSAAASTSRSSSRHARTSSAATSCSSPRRTASRWATRGGWSTPA
jgi:N-acetyl-gamma-glutamylphosphate reductase